MYIKLFGYLIAAGVLFTSLAMYVMGARWQAVEQAGYGGKSRPWWFYLPLRYSLPCMGNTGAAFSGDEWRAVFESPGRIPW